VDQVAVVFLGQAQGRLVDMGRDDRAGDQAVGTEPVK